MKPVVSQKPVSELKPLDVKCSDHNCKEGFHFFTSKVAPKGGKIGDCKKCGDNSIDWARIYKRNPADIKYTFDSLKKELLRHVCWVNEIEPKAITNAVKRGKIAVLEKARHIISSKIAKIPVGHYDYLGTPKKGGEIVNYAQHATATCCRKCLERWHNIDQTHVLTKEEIEYCVGLIEYYIDDRISDIPDEPQNNTDL